MKINTIIKAIIIYSLITMLNPLFAVAQPSLKGTWCNGGNYLMFQKKTGKRVLFAGGDLHEGGAYLTLEWVKDNRFKKIKNKHKDGYGLYDDEEVEVKDILIEEFDYGTYMLVFDVNHFIVDVMRKLKDNETEYSSMMNELSIVALDGKYKDNKGNIISIDGRNMTFEGLGNNKQKFSMPEGIYQFPMSDILRLDNGKTYKYVCQYGKLLIVPIDLKTIKSEVGYRVDFEAYEAAGITDEDPSKVIGDTILLSKFDDDNLGGYYPILSEQVIMSSIPHYLASDYKERMEILESILNEIYARHGYSFPEEPKKKAMFAGRKWYKPTVKEIEQLGLSYTEIINLNSLEKIINYAKENM